MNKSDRTALRISGVRVAAATPTEAVERIVQSAKQNKDHSYHFINAYTVSLAVKDTRLLNTLNQSTSNYPDGKPLSWLGKMRGVTCHQIRGPQTFDSVLSTGRTVGLNHFFLGGPEETLATLIDAVQQKYPGIAIAGSYCPPFRKLTDSEREDQDELIRRSGADIVWVGLGTPKQDFETCRLAKSVPVTAAAVGAAFDFSAGTKRVAPEWVSKIGFEWLFRFVTEPRRLWRRYTIGNTRFIYHAIKNWRQDAIL